MDAEEAKSEYGVSLSSKNPLKQLDAVIACVDLSVFKGLSKDDWSELVTVNAVVMDIKGIVNQNDMAFLGITLWRL